MLDVTLLQNINNTLLNLEQENFNTKSIKLKVLSKDLKRIYYISFNSYQEFLNTNSVLLSTSGPTKWCFVGDFPFLENIQVINKNTNYELGFYFYNIISENPMIKDVSTFSGTLNSFILNDKVKYKKFLTDRFIELNNRNIELADLRLSSYVDACYVDIDYVDNEMILIENSIREKINK